MGCTCLTNASMTFILPHLSLDKDMGWEKGRNLCVICSEKMSLVLPAVDRVVVWEQ